MQIVYFSSVSGYTKRFVEKLNLPAVRIPLYPKKEEMPELTEPSVLIVPTYGAGPRTKAVPKQVIAFLKNPKNREHIKGVIGTGNTNFFESYGLAADIIAGKLEVPVLYKLEMFGTSEDVEKVNEGLEKFFKGGK